MKIIKLLSKFEDNNNVSVYLEIFTDGSGQVKECWGEDNLFEFANLKQFKWACKNYLLPKGEGFRSLTTKSVEIKDIMK